MKTSEQKLTERARHHVSARESRDWSYNRHDRK